MKQFEQLSANYEVFSDPRLNERFFKAIEILTQLMMAMPRAVSEADLAKSCDVTPRMVRSILRDLNQSKLVALEAKLPETWHCRDYHGVVTLADVYHCFANIVEQKRVKQETSSNVASVPKSMAQQNVDLMLMQVKMSLNRTMLSQLQQFDLGRFRGLANQASNGAHTSVLRAYMADPD